MLFWFRKLSVDFRHFRVFVFCHRTYSKTRNPRKILLLLLFDVRFFQTQFINASLNLVKYFVTFVKFIVISVISGVSGNSGESTWPKIFLSIIYVELIFSFLRKFSIVSTVTKYVRIFFLFLMLLFQSLQT